MAKRVGKLSLRQRKFADEYMIDYDPVRAYRKIYKPDANYNSASATASRIVHLPQVQEYMDKRQRELQAASQITPESVVKELANIAFSDPLNYAKIVKKPEEEGKKNKSGNYDMEITPTDELSENVRKAIGGIEKTKYGVQYKMCDKVKALELLGKHLGMFNDKVELSGKVDNDITINIVPDAPEEDEKDD